MAEQGREPRSPNSITHDQPHPRRGDELRQGGPFQRSDSGHLANHVGKNARTNPKLRADFGETNEPVQGGRRDVIE